MGCNGAVEEKGCMSPFQLIYEKWTAVCFTFPFVVLGPRCRPDGIDARSNFGVHFLFGRGAVKCLRMQKAQPDPAGRRTLPPRACGAGAGLVGAWQGVILWLAAFVLWPARQVLFPSNENWFPFQATTSTGRSTVKLLPVCAESCRVAVEIPT